MAFSRFQRSTQGPFGSPQGLAQGSGSTWWGKGGRNPRADYGQSIIKVPPYWDPTLENKGYPFRTWIRGLDVWAAGTELPAQLQAPAVVQRLGGAARDLVREIPTTELRDGRQDPVTGDVSSGLNMLTQGWTRRFGQFAVETSTSCIINMLTFRRLATENVDESLSRFETLRMQVRGQAAGFDLPVPVTSWLLLEAMHIPRRTWPLVLAPWHGRMPEDNEGLKNLCESIRHQGHIAETPENTWRRQGASTNSYLEESCSSYVAREGSQMDISASEWEPEDP